MNNPILEHRQKVQERILKGFEDELEKAQYVHKYIRKEVTKTGKTRYVYAESKNIERIKGKKKIVSVHSRNAEIELLDMLCEFEIKNVIFHWYSGPVDLIPSIIERGFYFSINESMCRSKNGQSIIGKIPREKILTETDAPYNNRTNIRMVLNQLNMSEVDIFYNFNRLLNDIK